MNVKQIVKRLEEIMCDLPAEAMRQGSELDDLIEELKNPPKPTPREYGLIIARHIGLEEFFTGTRWSRKLQEACVYQKVGTLHYGEEVYRVVRDKNGKIRRIFQ